MVSMKATWASTMSMTPLRIPAISHSFRDMSTMARYRFSMISPKDPTRDSLNRYTWNFSFRFRTSTPTNMAHT